MSAVSNLPSVELIKFLSTNLTPEQFEQAKRLVAVVKTDASKFQIIPTPPKGKISSKKDEALAILGDITERLNFYFASYDFPYFVSTPDITEEEATNLLKAVQDYKIFDNEIESGLIATLDMNQAISALLPVQSGKSKTAILVTIFERIRAYFSGQKCEFVYVVPNDLSIQKMTIESYEDLYLLFGRLKFEAKDGQSASFYDIAKLGNSDRNENGSSVPRIHALTNSKEVQDKIKNYIIHADATGARLVIIWDEAHYAENKGSVADKTIGPTIKNIVQELKSKHKLICLSATPFPYCDLPGVMEVSLKVGEDYYGINCWKGRLIDPKASFKTPKYISFTQLQIKLGLKNIPLSPSAFFNQKIFKKLRLPFTQQQYFDEGCQQIAAFIRYDIKNGRLASLLRFLNNNHLTDRILEKLRVLLPDVQFIKHYGKTEWNKIVKELKHCVHDLKKYCVIIVSKRARMSNRISLEVETFIDCTTKYSTVTSAIQGLCGRSACYGKQRTVILTDINHKIITTYIETKGNFDDKSLREICKKCRVQLHQRASLSHKDTKAQFSVQITKDDHEVMSHLMTILGERINELKQKKAKRVTGGFYDYDALLSESFIKLLEKKYPIIVLRKGQVPDAIMKDFTNENERKLRQYHMDDTGKKTFVSFRKTKKGLYSGREEKRTSSMKQNEKKRRGIELHVHLSETFTIEFFEVAVLRFVDKAKSPCKILPGKNSMFADGLSENKNDS